MKRFLVLAVVGLLGLGGAAALAPSLPSARAGAAEPQPVTVYVTRTGKKYHRDGCQHLRKSKIAMSLADAKKTGYGPCSVCNPPP